MKKLLLGIALFTIGCSNQSLTGPSATETRPGETAGAPGVSTSANEPAQGAGGGSEVATPAASASPTLQYTVDGPRGCLSAGTEPMRWDLLVSDAGPSAIRFVALSHQSPDPGCDPTIDSPRDRIRVTGQANYAPHTTGQTQFTFDPTLYSCGRVQADVSAFDATGKETLLVGMVVNYGTTCAPPPPPPPPPPPSEARLECRSQAQRVTVNQLVNLAASGGTGAFSWQAPAGSPEAGNGSSFTTSYTSAGTHTVTVFSGNQQATCTLVVETVPPQSTPLACTPASQTVLTNQAAVLSATGGTGAYSWTASSGTPSSGQGASFTTNFTQAGTHTVTVSSGTATTSCAVAVTPPPPPPCSAVNPPSFTVSFPYPTGPSLVGLVEVKNAGAWTLHLYAASTRDRYESNTPDLEADTAAQTLACGETSTLKVKGYWGDSSARFWWMVLKRNGSVVYKSTVELNPTLD